MRRVLVVFVTLTLLGAACSLPTDEEAVVIDPEDLPDVLREDLVLETTDTPAEPGPQTVTAEIYLLDAVGDRNVVVPREREVTNQAGFAERISLLFGQEIRTEEEQEFFSNALREYTLIDAFINENDVAIIDMVALDDDGAEVEIEGEVFRNAAAQLVYTATGFPDVLAVRIRINGEAVIVPTSEGGDTDAVLTRADYLLYDPSIEVTTTTVPLSSSTTTTEAADSSSGSGDG